MTSIGGTAHLKRLGACIITKSEGAGQVYLSAADRTVKLLVEDITLPSDRVTLAQIRREHPKAFLNYQSMANHSISELNIAATIACELDLARVAFDKALSNDQRHMATPSEHSREQSLAMINDDYVRYGISSGMKATRHLVKGIEEAARKQAAVAGRSR